MKAITFLLHTQQPILATSWGGDKQLESLAIQGFKPINLKKDSGWRSLIFRVLTTKKEAFGRSP